MDVHDACPEDASRRYHVQHLLDGDGAQYVQQLHCNASSHNTHGRQYRIESNRSAIQCWWYGCRAVCSSQKRQLAAGQDRISDRIIRGGVLLVAALDVLVRRSCNFLPKKSRVAIDLRQIRRPRSHNSNKKWAYVIGALLLFSAVEIIAGHSAGERRSITQAHDELIGSIQMHEWSSREWPQFSWSTTDTSTPLISSEDGELQEDWLSRRLCWYVSFAEIFKQFKAEEHEVAIKRASLLMKDALAWHESDDGWHEPQSKRVDRRNAPNPLLRFFSRPRRDCHVINDSESFITHAELPYTELTWIEAPKCKGLAMVCIAPSEKLGVIAVRGSVNIKNIMMALKVWPKPSKKDMGLSLHTGFAEVADELWEKIEPLLA